MTAIKREPTYETATERVLAEEIVPAIAQLLGAIERLTVALALDAHVKGKLPRADTVELIDKIASANPRRRPAKGRNRRSR
jgi:hypothetical protein